MAEAGFDGLVLAAMGAGHIPQRMLPALEEVVSRIPVAATSRTDTCSAGAQLSDRVVRQLTSVAMSRCCRV
jgi:L-asparaginase/Glu-tRNA(Gln) amidotransferase subunit D